MNADNTILSRWLTLLGVPHTAQYSDMRFRTMPFPTYFGLTALLREYSVEAKGYTIDDKSQIASIPTPFIAPVNGRNVIVTAVDGDTLRYCTVGISEEIPVADFTSAWEGVALTATTTTASKEPGYARHRLGTIMASLRDIGIWVIGIVLFAWFYITRGDLHNWGTATMAALDIFGLWLSYMLVQKTLGVKSKRGDAVCSVLQAGGCDTIAKSDASTFLGIFHWSEVGLTYFGVGLAVLLLFPEMTGWLAAINICALPYTVWSITYQKFVAKTWCTMCVGVQLTLWLQFIVFICSGWVGHIFPLTWQTAALVLVYAFVMLLLNRIDAFINTRKPTET